MFDFISSSLVLAPMIVDCAAIGPKYLADELEWNTRPVFLPQNPTYVEALRAKRCCRYNSIILLQAFDDLGLDHDDHILPECAGQASHYNK
jgi:hypothetical protein